MRGGRALEVWLRPLYRSQEWGARALPVVVVGSETTPLMAQNRRGEGR
jgi:hypothetical protein